METDGCIRRRSGQFAQGFRRREDTPKVVISAGGWAASRSKDKAGTRREDAQLLQDGGEADGDERGQGSKKKEYPPR